ncbi:hypothetical protein [Dethiothermospora halolimnae]|uniref:hypothetical protein n=1 Tax=Dethiothermospora halolimnae TaxID=3114390 RepID=UPI003CCB7C6A
MSSYYFFFVFAFLVYYLFRKFVDTSLPLIPIIHSYKSADDVINAIEMLIILFIGGILGFFFHWLINLII